MLSFRVFLAICFLLIVTFIGLDIGNDKHRLISLSGIVVYIFVTWITSVAPSRVRPGQSLSPSPFEKCFALHPAGAKNGPALV